MKITYYVHDLSFPLVEGIRKQAWLLAQEMKKLGHQVEIISTSKKKGTDVKEGIVIRYGSSWTISDCQTDLLHYLSHPTPLIVPLLLRAKAQKQVMTIFGGELHHFWKRSWDGVVSRLVKKKVSPIILQTKYQQSLLRKTRLRNIPVILIPPLLPIIKRSGERTPQPSLLFMSHLSPYKGIIEVLSAFETLRKDFSGIQLVIADSGIRRDERIYQKITEMNRGDITLKKEVDPAEELSKTWVYLYPIQSAHETFSVPLSFIEALQVGTPYIGTTVGGIPEYFPTEHLVTPANVPELVEKIRLFLTTRKIPESLRQPIVNDLTIQQLFAVYQDDQSTTTAH